jgi:hypothetical protein
MTFMAPFVKKAHDKALTPQPKKVSIIFVKKAHDKTLTPQPKKVSTTFIEKII